MRKFDSAADFACRELIALGIPYRILPRGKHAILEFGPGYCLNEFIPLSSSDRRAGLNLRSAIRRKLRAAGISTKEH